MTVLGFTVVRSRIIPNNRGFERAAAMVQVASIQEAAAVIAKLNGREVAGQDGPETGLSRLPQGGATLSVKYAGQDQMPSDNLYVSGLPALIDQTSLNKLFTSAGHTVIRSKVIPDTRGTGFGAAMVQLGSIAEAEAAIRTFNGQVVAEPPSAYDHRPASVARASSTTAAGSGMLL